MIIYGHLLILLCIAEKKILADKIHFSKWIKTDTSFPWNVYVFETLLVKGLDHCIESCKAKRMCEFVNFEVAADTCYLVGTNKTQGSTLESLENSRQTKAGYVFGNRSEWNLKRYESCSDCEPKGVCTHDAQSSEKSSLCQNAGCVPPEQRPFTTIFGNMFSTGSKINYQCDEGFIEVSGGRGQATCQKDGTWAAIDVICKPTFFENFWYRLHKTGRNWQHAKEYCNSLGGNLANIKTKSIQDFMENVFLSPLDRLLAEKHIWIGGSDIEHEGKFIWSDGTPVSAGYTNWGLDQPNRVDGQDCIHYTIFSSGMRQHKWFDAGCDHKLWSICEFQNHVK